MQREDSEYDWTDERLTRGAEPEDRGLASRIADERLTRGADPEDSDRPNSRSESFSVWTRLSTASGNVRQGPGAPSWLHGRSLHPVHGDRATEAGYTSPGMEQFAFQAGSAIAAVLTGPSTEVVVSPAETTTTGGPEDRQASGADGQEWHMWQDAGRAEADAIRAARVAVQVWCNDMMRRASWAWWWLWGCVVVGSPRVTESLC